MVEVEQAKNDLTNRFALFVFLIQILYNRGMTDLTSEIKKIFNNAEAISTVVLFGSHARAKNTQNKRALQFLHKIPDGIF